MPSMKGVWCRAMRECMVGIMTVSVGPRMGAGRREQVGKEAWLACRTRDSAWAFVLGVRYRYGRKGRWVGGRSYF